MAEAQKNPCEIAIQVPVCGGTLNLDSAPFGDALTREDVQAMIEASRYSLCEFYFFRHPDLRPGFELADGRLLENASILYPEAWAYLQTEHGQKLCKTENEWQDMTKAVWHTNADGTEVGWDGIGGAPFFAMHLETGALRLPDLRGMYAEAAGFDGLAVGGVHGDAVRPVTGTHFFGQDADVVAAAYQHPTGAFVYGGKTSDNLGNLSLISHANSSWMPLQIDSSRVVPTANKNQPRAWGALTCVYLGLSK